MTVNELHSKIVDINTWAEYSENSMSGFFDYIQATEETNNCLKEILAKAHNFKELKNDLTGFVNERDIFLKFADKHYP